MGDYFGDYDPAVGPPDPHGRSKALFPTVESADPLEDISAAIDAELDAWEDILTEARIRRAKRSARRVS